MLIIYRRVHNLPIHSTFLFYTVPTFQIQPVSYEARSDNNETDATAAFSCSVTNIDNLELVFIWKFNQINSNFSITLSSEQEGVTILGSPDFVDPGTTVLILESVSAANKGWYYCEVEYCCGTITSQSAELTYSGKLENV